MRAFTLPVSVLLMAALSSSCAEQRAPTDPADPSRKFLPLSTSLTFDADTRTFTVSPTGTDDTENIQAALDGCVDEGPGCTVRLTAGTFHTGFIEIRNFDGTLQGEGRGITVVRSLPALPCAEKVDQNSWPSLFKFRESNVHISDLTFHITEFSPCQEWQVPLHPISRHLGSVLMITGFTPPMVFRCADPPRFFANSAIERVDFLGGPGTLAVDPSPETYNVQIHLLISGEQDFLGSCPFRITSLSGAHVVSNSSFRQALQGSFFVLVDGQLTVGGGSTEGNSFADVNSAILLVDNSRSEIEVSNNTISNTVFWGVLVDQGRDFIVGNYPLPQASTYSITRNVIDATVLTDAVGLGDRAVFVGRKSIDAVVTNNDITLNTHFGGIVGLGAQDAVVSNNRIRGTGLAGIYMGFGVFAASGWTLLGNNVQNVDALVAPIWLGPRTSNCTVVGGNNRSNVFDQGVDNILTGVKNMQGNDPGQEIKDAMRHKRELLNSMTW